MSLNDPFFDAWVRDKLQHSETNTPEHLWNDIRKSSRRYVMVERNKYFIFLFLLLTTTGGIGYWAFHPIPKPRLTARIATSIPAVGPASTAGHTLVRSMGSASLEPLTSRVVEGTISGIPSGAASDSGLLAASLAAGTTATPDESQPMPTPSTLTVISNHELALFPGNAIAFRYAIAAGNYPVFPSMHQKRNTYLEIFAGPDHVAHYITASAPMYNNYVRQVHAMESSYPSFNAGMRVDVPLIGDDWRLQLGIHFSQINERLDYFNFNETKTVSQVSIRRVVQSGGDTVLIADTARVTEKGQYFKQSLNAYRSLDIPLIVSRTLFRTAHLQLNGSGGALFNVVSRYSGDILDTSMEPAAIRTKLSQGAAAWKSSIGTSLFGSLALFDQVLPRVQIGIEPYLKYDLSTVNKDVSIYRERFITTGLQFSLRFQLNK